MKISRAVLESLCGNAALSVEQQKTEYERRNMHEFAVAAQRIIDQFDYIARQVKAGETIIEIEDV